MPTLMFDILGRIVASEPDMAVVGRVNDGDFLATAQQTGADVILIGREAKHGREQHDEYEQLLLRQPCFKVLAIANDGRTAALYELHPRRIELGEMSADTLRKAIRGPAAEL
jgi:hypothetical protein